MPKNLKNHENAIFSFLFLIRVFFESVHYALRFGLYISGYDKYFFTEWNLADLKHKIKTVGFLSFASKNFGEISAKLLTKIHIF